ncbi:tRNA (N6-threonylcarbamoyladenosine(37)-N6)-methyltransferase TrmO [Psychrobacter urativorans]|uniref:tRNA-Thr(GGU) m(6)t(6)A37 methyltransferase TsaA n=1 Tax=Psychrobacter urativorans TaxID=45610 RepID=A0A0M4T442_9GAMM|nr:tRNA (N6-threonylcarbamoyladenosine(37)-N6)-methyltransferase TrmO [Psychrobacter urativorans]ALF60715.1 tRNA-Thr(GGU) m(6)t(6)A37 methyltransferase TsaA [Psychrobacter urativorans]
MEKSDIETAHFGKSHVAPIIGYHRAPLSQKFGAPRQPNLVALTSVIEMLAPYDTPAAFVGLEAFSHIWISWQFHHNFINKASQAAEADAHKFRAQVRPPRLGGNQKIGVFASRSMYRPSGLGLSVVKLERVEVVAGRVLLIISGADMIDGTPIVDIKPYIAYSDALVSADSGFASTAPAPLMVTITEQAREQFQQIIAMEQGSDTNNSNHKGNENKASVAEVIYQYQQQLMAADIDNITALIAQDPRPAYRQQELHTLFTMRYKAVDVSFQRIKSGQLQIVTVTKID